MKPVVPLIFCPLIFITTLAALLRFYHLAWNSLWLDEVVTWVISKASLVDIFLYMVRGEYNPPLFYWVEHFTMPVFGVSEAALRLMPALFGILTLVPTYYLGKRIGGEVTGILSALMLSVSVFAIYYSQEARGYTLFMLLFVAGLYLYLMGLENGEGRYWAGSVLCFAGAIWTNFYALVFVTITLVCTPIILGKGKELVASWRYWVVFTGLVTPILGVVGGLYFLREAHEVANGLQGLDVLPYSFLSLAGSAIPIAVIFLILLGWSVAFKGSKEKVFLLAVIFLPIIIGVPVSWKITILPRYFAPAAVLIFVLVADAWEPFTHFVGFDTYCKIMRPVFPFQKPRIIGSLVFLALISLNLFVLPIYYNTLQKDDWRGMIGFLDNRTQPGDHIVSVPAYRLDWEMQYYYNNTTRGTVLLGAYNISDVQRACSGARCYIIITRDNTGHYTSAEVQDWVEKNARHLEDFEPTGHIQSTLPQMKVYVI